VHWLVKRWSLKRPPRAGVVAALATVLGSMTFARALVFESPLALWGDTLSRNPSPWRLQFHYGEELIELAERPGVSVAGRRRLGGGGGCGGGGGVVAEGERAAAGVCGGALPVGGGVGEERGRGGGDSGVCGGDEFGAFGCGFSV